MKRKGIVFAGYVLLILAFPGWLTGCGGSTSTPVTKPAEAQVEITVSAAASLKDAMAEIQAQYLKQKPNVKIVNNYAGSGALQQQIEQGAPVDLFISAAVKQMDDLEKKNLIKKETRKNIVENQLVLIVPKESKLEITSFQDLAKPEVKMIALGAPESVPAGQYTQQLLKKLNLWVSLQTKMVLAKDVRSVLAYVETGNVDAGTVYSTDAAVSGKVKVVATAPAGSHDPILYPMAVIAASKQLAAATEFATYLAGPEAQAIFKKFGFAIPR